MSGLKAMGRLTAAVNGRPAPAGLCATSDCSGCFQPL